MCTTIDGETYLDQFYTMDPETEDVIPGRKLENGMVVLIEDSSTRGNPDRLNTESEISNKYERKRCQENNRWCQVTELEKSHNSEGGTILRFIGVYDDGTKAQRMYNQSYAWIVKKPVALKPRIVGILVSLDA